MLSLSHAWASLSLMLVRVLTRWELNWILLSRWHLVVELRKHRWEVAAHVLRRRIRSVRRRVLWLTHELLLLLWSRGLTVLSAWLRHIVQLLTWLRLTCKSWRSDCTTLIHEEVLLLLWTCIRWEYRRRFAVVSTHSGHTALLHLRLLLSHCA